MIRSFKRLLAATLLLAVTYGGTSAFAWESCGWYQDACRDGGGIPWIYYETCDYYPEIDQTLCAFSCDYFTVVGWTNCSLP